MIENSMLCLLITAVLVSCSPNRSDRVREISEVYTGSSQEVSASKEDASEIVPVSDSVYITYLLDQGAVAFYVPKNWELYMDGGAVLAFQNGSSYFQAERFIIDGHAGSLQDVIIRECSLLLDDSRSIQSEMISIEKYEGIVSAFSREYAGGKAGSLYIGTFSVRQQYYVLYYLTRQGFIEEDYEAFKNILGQTRVNKELVPLLPAEDDKSEENVVPKERDSDNQDLSESKVKTSGYKEDIDFSLKDIPKYDHSPYVEVNNGIPFFTEDDMTKESFQDYAPFDDLGRCGRAMACLGPETMPDKPRGSIGMIRPSGWRISRYKDIDGTYLYNRCHLIGYQLSGQNANELNLITGTRYMNMTGMEPFESRTAGYIETTGHHVLYRVTPLYVGDDLVARGVLMEAKSVEDQDLQFCVFCYNVQPGIIIDYSDGSSSGEGYLGSDD